LYHIFFIHTNISIQPVQSYNKKRSNDHEKIVCRWFYNVQNLFSQCSESVQNFQSMFRIFSNVQTLFRISSTKTGLFRISLLCIVLHLILTDSEHWLNRVWTLLNILNIDWKFWTDSKHWLNRFSTLWTLTEISEQILNILSKCIMWYFTYFFKIKLQQQNVQ
jgi:hypothetical protein